MSLSALIGLLIGALLSALLLQLAMSPPLITPWLALLFVLLSIAIFQGGRGVRRFKRGEKTRVGAVDAARIAMFARSAAINGAAFSGFFLGIGAVSLFRLWAPTTVQAAIGAGIALAGSLLLAGISWLVEHWCVDDSADDWDQEQGGGPGGSGKPTGTARMAEREGRGWLEQ